MNAKKEWNKPQLEVLQVHMTEATNMYGNPEDEAWVEGQPNWHPHHQS